jgi:UDP-N-acetylmuramoyl-L-alanyl-D-glutamate--2,6-diaminopimelate ligase
MGRLASELADVAIITDDNPRSEKPADIRAEMLKGAGPDAVEIGDRREAIRKGVAMMRDGDILVIAGKGHEQGQIVGGVTYPFDDVKEAQAAIEGVKS